MEQTAPTTVLKLFRETRLVSFTLMSGCLVKILTVDIQLARVSTVALFPLPSLSLLVLLPLLLPAFFNLEMRESPSSLGKFEICG